MGPLSGIKYQQLAVVQVKHGSRITIFDARSAYPASTWVCHSARAPCSQEFTVSNNSQATPNFYSLRKEHLMPNIK